VTSALSHTLAGRVLLLAEQFPDRVALREKELGIWRETTWTGYAEAVAATGRALWELGVRPGDHVSILSDNRTEWLFADLGAQGIGARAVGVYQTNPADDVAYVLSHSGSRVLVCEDQEQVDKAIDVAEQTPTVEHVLVIDPRGTRTYEDPRLQTWDDFLARGHALMAEEPDWFRRQVHSLDPAAPSMVVYTSGTTGQPKGALISSQNVIPSAEQMVPLLGITERDFLLSYLPLCHVAEKIFTFFIPLTTGAVVHFGESIDTIREDLREVSPTVFLGVPRIWEKMAANVDVKMRDSSWIKRTLYDRFAALGRRLAAQRLAGQALSLKDRILWRIGDLLVFRPLQERLGLRRCALPISGAAPISQELLSWFHGIGVPISEAYGMTECGGASHINPPDRIRLGSVGTAIPGTECVTAADGEILMRGSHVFCGYLHNPEATAETIDEDGWLHTGDLGRLDEQGYLSITGRKKEIIITAGGKNLSPERIENALKASPYIKEAIAIGDARKFVSALVQIEYDTVGAWASRRGIPYTAFADLASKEEVVKLVEGEVGRANEQLARVESVRGIRLLPKELHQDDGELTATQKVRRSAVHERYAALIESMYQGRSS